MFPVPENSQRIGNIKDFIDAVGNIDDRYALVTEVSDDTQHAFHFRHRQGRGWLIHDQDLYVGRKGPGDLNDLLLGG